MAKLDNPRWEKFAELTATGQKRADAYIGAGYRTKTREVATKRGGALYAKPEIKARVTEIETALRENSVLRAEVDREWVLRGLKENIHRASQVKPVLNRQGEPTGQYKYEPSAVNRGYELVGKELGMFVERYSMENLDATLEGLSGDELRAYLRGAAMEVGLRMLDMTEDETRQFILKHAPRLGLEVTPAPVH